ncbi:MAG: response regulator [Chlorobi bacterium]|nr:response regulator [Chlorobiota bacterium]
MFQRKVVDDDSYSVILLKEFLKKKYAYIYSVNNGKEAIEFCGNHAVGLILTDILMPEMNVIDAYKEIKKTHKQIRVIAQTAYTDKSKTDEIHSAGIDHIIFKPYRKEDLLSIIEETLNITGNLAVNIIN